jgi:hypothetical protein
MSLRVYSHFRYKAHKSILANALSSGAETLLAANFRKNTDESLENLSESSRLSG